MANTGIDALYPEFWFASFDNLDVGDYNLQNSISRDTESLLAKAGDSVTVPLVPSLNDADDWSPGEAIVAENIAQESVKVTLNKTKRKTIALQADELSMSPYMLIEKYGVAMAKTILRQINSDIYLELMKTPNWVDAIAGVTSANIVSAKKLLDIGEVSKAGRSLISGPTDMEALLNLSTFQQANTSGSAVAMTQGILPPKFGFAIEQNNLLEKYTPADVAGAIDNVAGYVIGDTSIAVNGFNDDLNLIRPGDMFIIAGEAGTPYHTVVDTTLTAGDTTGIVFTPALTGAVANADVVTITPTRSMLALVPDCAGFAARTFAALPAGVGVNSSTMNYNGLPIRISVWHNGAMGVNVQYDILYGTKMVKSSRIVRILTAA